MGLATIIALLAFFVALVALWLVSDVLKKVEQQNDKFVRAHVKGLREELHELSLLLGKSNKAMQELRDQGSATDKRINDHTAAIDKLQTRIAELRTEFETLDRSIPQRYRSRNIPAAAPKGKAGTDKATVQ